MSEEIRKVYKEGQEGEEEFAEEFIEEENGTGIEEVEDSSGEILSDEGSFGADYTGEIPSGAAYAEADTDFEARVRKRKARVRNRKRRRKILSVIVIIAAFAVLATMCGRDIVRLKAENIALQKQQEELEEQRDRLREEVKNSGKREYVQEQARKQLRLLNPGELLFTFEEEEK